MMQTYYWFSMLSVRQRIVPVVTLVVALAIIVFGLASDQTLRHDDKIYLNTTMSIRQIAPELEVTGKALAKELNLPLEVPKGRPIKEFGITEEELSHIVDHLRSHVDSTGKYYLFFAMVLVGFIYLNVLGRPHASDIKQTNNWYPRLPYIGVLLFSMVVSGFYLGKSPNPMEGTVKVLKSMVGLHPDPLAKVTAFLFFVALAVIGNKMVCGWACPFGALQELIYSIPILGKLKRNRLPFLWTNTIRLMLLVVTLLLLFGLIGGRKGFVIYHYINPFNLFNLDFGIIGVGATVLPLWLDRFSCTVLFALLSALLVSFPGSVNGSA